MGTPWARMMGEKAKVIRAELPVKRLIAVSDVHGSCALFQALLKKIGYTPGEDGLVVAGDLVQKGSENIKTLRFAMELAKHPNTYFLHGNHELLLEQDDEALFGYIDWWKERSLFGEMLAALGQPLPKGPEDIPAMRKQLEGAFGEELAFLRGLPDILETDKLIFAHAGLKDEDLDHALLGPVVEWPRFHETAEHTFQKLLVVGHYPAANFRDDSLSNAPIYNREKNVLTIDGGNVIKSIGLLNAVIFDPATARWTWDCADPFPKIEAPCSQAGAEGKAIVWPGTGAEILARGEVYTLCRYADGTELEVPNDMLHETAEGVSTGDVTTQRLAVEKGETVSLLRSYPDRLLIMKRGTVGWLYL